MPLGMEVVVGPGGIVLDGGSSCPLERGKATPHFLARVLWPNGRPSQLLQSSCSSWSALQQHVNIHIGKYKYTECGRCCDSSYELVVPVQRQIHSTKKPFEFIVLFHYQQDCPQGNCWYLFFVFNFYRRMNLNANRGIAIVIMSICLSVTFVHCD